MNALIILEIWSRALTYGGGLCQLHWHTCSPWFSDKVDMITVIYLKLCVNESKRSFIEWYLFRLTNQLLLLRNVVWKLNSIYFGTCGMLASDLNSYSPTRSKSKFILANLASAIRDILASQIFHSPLRVGECLCCTLIRARQIAMAR